MSDSENTTPEVTAEGMDPAAILESLKARADTLGLKYHPKIGIDALREKITEAMAEPGDEGEGEGVPEEDKSADEKPLTKLQKEAAMREKLRKEKMKLIRVRISNLNPAKKDLHGEIVTVANKFLGTVRKYIPFGEATDEGYHVPQVLLDQLKARKFQSIKTITKKGQIEVKTRMVPEFAIEVLDPLTADELEKLATQQRAAAGL